MADDQEVAALKAQLALLQQDRASNTDGKTRHYIVRAQVMDECYMPIEGPEPPTEPEGGESVHARLDRIEEQLQRVVAMLEKQGT